MKISFDFDNTLSNQKCQEVALRLKNEGHNICITTSRRTNGYGILCDNSDLYGVADRLNIKDVTFTELRNKVNFLIKNNIDIHVDDDKFELELLKKTKIIPIQVSNCSWIKKLFKKVNK